MKSARLCLAVVLAALAADARPETKKPSDTFSESELKSLEVKDLAVGAAGYLDGESAKPRNGMPLKVSRVVSPNRLVVFDLNDKRRPFVLDVDAAGIVDGALFTPREQFPRVRAWLVTGTAKVGGRTMFVVAPITGKITPKD